jgi:hypothetical protein
MPWWLHIYGKDLVLVVIGAMLIGAFVAYGTMYERIAWGAFLFGSAGWWLGVLLSVLR